MAILHHDKDVIVRLYYQGLSLSTLATRFRVGKASIRETLIAAGVDLRPPGHPERPRTGARPGQGRKCTAKEVAEREARYVAMRRSGKPSPEVRDTMGISESLRDHLEALYRAVATHPAKQRDNSCPAFAHDDKHVAAVMREGGFIAFSDNGNPREALGICLPILAPRRDAHA